MDSQILLGSVMKSCQQNGQKEDRASKIAFSNFERIIWNWILLVQFYWKNFTLCQYIAVAICQNYIWIRGSETTKTTED